MQAAEESSGKIIAVSDDEILVMQSQLAGEGIWVEPASAAGLAGLAAQIKSGVIHPAGTVVAVCTGHGLKDPDAVTRRMQPPLVLPASLEALEAAIIQ